MDTIIGFFIFQLHVPVISRALGSSNIKDEKYQAWEVVFQHQMKHWEESWKYDVQQSVSDELWGVLHLVVKYCVEYLILLLKQKWFYQEKLGMQKRAVFHPFSKHLLNINFLCIFLMNYWWVWKVETKLNIQIL